MIYDNSSYLDKLLDTSFFSLKSRHFQVRGIFYSCKIEIDFVTQK